MQISDIHLDGQISSSLAFTVDKLKERESEIRKVFADAIQMAIERRVEIILLPGDLWEDEHVSPDTIGWLGDQFRLLENHAIPVFIAPGNHDFFSSECGYSREFRQRERLPDWPSNVFVFTSGDFQTECLTKMPNVTVTGRAFRQNVVVDERLLRQKIPHPDGEISLLLFHGSRLRGVPQGGKPLITAPFEDEELLTQKFSYVALGHYHTYQTISDTAGRIRAAYSGSPIGRMLYETGERGMLILKVGPDGVLPGAEEFITLDRRRIIRARVDLTGATHLEAMENRIRESMQQEGARQDDIMYIELMGRHPPSISPDFPKEFLTDYFWHVRVVNATEPDYDLEAYRARDARTVDARFAREILRRLEASGDPEERAQLKEALYLGLDALIQGRITVREFDELIGQG